jgi:hypothetical protein
LFVCAALSELVIRTGYDPVTETLSILATTGRAQWIMTTGFVISAICQIVTAVGLSALRLVPRLALAVAGCCGLAVAAFPTHLHGPAMAHILAAGAGAVVLAVFPVLAMTGAASAPRACRARWAVTGSIALTALLAWVYWEANNGEVLGLAERVAAYAEFTWPLLVVLTARRSTTVRVEAPPLPPVDHPRRDNDDEHRDHHGANPIGGIQHTGDVVGDESVGRQRRHSGMPSGPALQRGERACEVHRLDRDSPYRRQHVPHNRAAPAQGHEPANDQITDEREMRDDGKHDHCEIHRLHG